MKISIIVEGATEQVFQAPLRGFLKQRVPRGKMPRLDTVPQNGRIPTGEKLQRLVGKLLTGASPADAVIALTDVYTGTRDFKDAEDAKRKMRQWVGAETRFYPHVAQHDFEAWLIPFWADIKRLSGTAQGKPGKNPENINHNKPPAHLLRELFNAKKKRYSKPTIAARVLEKNDLAKAAAECPSLKNLLNEILELCGTQPL